MRLHLLSDLHSEFGHTNLRSLVCEADVLALLGDIHTGIENVLAIIHELAPHYKDVIYVPGNHEYYGRTIHDLDGIETVLPSNVHYLNPGYIVIDGIRFAGATLWAQAGDRALVHRYINDFRRIRNFRTTHCRELNAQHATFLYENPADVVLTHFIPRMECVHPRWLEQPISAGLSEHYFVGHCAPPARLHCFGHTHDRTDITIDNTRYVSNPYGYPGENKNYQPMILEV